MLTLPSIRERRKIKRNYKQPSFASRAEREAWFKEEVDRLVDLAVVAVRKALRNGRSEANIVIGLAPFVRTERTAKRLFNEVTAKLDRDGYEFEFLGTALEFMEFTMYDEKYRMKISWSR